MYVVDREGSRVVASITSRAVAVVVQTPVYLTGYSDCLPGFHEPLWTPYRYQAGLKNAYHVDCCLFCNRAQEMC